jgi:phenylacetate-CoA ligase
VKSIFTQGAKLFLQQRDIIEKIFNCRLYETYGLNDGGVSACECQQHNGMHIRTERSILETVDEDGKQILGKNGKILATSLYNYAQPFIRYETEDLGIMSDEQCSCGRGLLLLKEVTGRIQEYIITPENSRIYGQYFAHLFNYINGVSQFQIIQNELSSIDVIVVPDDWQKIKEIEQDIINNLEETESKNLKVNIKFVSENELHYTKAGKYQFVINNL